MFLKIPIITYYSYFHALLFLASKYIIYFFEHYFLHNFTYYVTILV